MALTVGKRRRTRSSVSNPPSFGMLMSRITTSGSWVPICSSRSSPSAASPQTSKSASRSSRRRKPSRTMPWSSAISTFVTPEVYRSPKREPSAGVLSRRAPSLTPGAQAASVLTEINVLPSEASRARSEEAPASRFVLYVEGPSDREILRAWAWRLAPDLARALVQAAVILGGRQPARAVDHFRALRSEGVALRGLCVPDAILQTAGLAVQDPPQTRLVRRHPPRRQDESALQEVHAKALVGEGG